MLCSRWRTCTLRRAREQTGERSGATCRTWVGSSTRTFVDFCQSLTAAICDTSAPPSLHSLSFCLVKMLLFHDIFVLCHPFTLESSVSQQEWQVLGWTAAAETHRNFPLSQIIKEKKLQTVSKLLTGDRKVSWRTNRYHQNKTQDVGVNHFSSESSHLKCKLFASPHNQQKKQQFLLP